MGGPILSYSTSVKIYNDDGTEYIPGEDEVISPEDTTILIIVLAVVIPVFGIGLGIAIYCYLKRRRSKIESIEVQ